MVSSVTLHPGSASRESGCGAVILKELQESGSSLWCRPGRYGLPYGWWWCFEGRAFGRQTSLENSENARALRTSCLAAFLYHKNLAEKKFERVGSESAFCSPSPHACRVPTVERVLCSVPPNSALAADS